ncbi:hypothetical protein BDV26DRAFT_277605 [Aspergillus bertholletiae]|uniref:Arrestin C-terminal-like domain-containing protein n=1 Tax=Aspergillus bertholletiae TaxID=1226010 RepID=A0A5N7BN08_9EURO|nr:hypothetical protein BDV26DRAFT_277605 [Aspergillus bertholletiae]
MLETIAFRGSSYHTYHVHAIIERRFSKNVILSEPIRIYKHFSIEDSLYWMSALNSISKQWDNVAQYSVSIPDVNIPFGATFPLKLWVAPLSKGLKLQALTINVVEQHELKINAPATYSAQFNVHFLSSKKENVIFSEGHSLDDCMTLESGESDIEWSATKWISLPQDLEAYSQDVSSSMIKINHQVEFTVELLGMGGKLSMIKGTIPFNIYMSPQVISEHGTVRRLHVDGSLDEYMDPPPLYSKHQNDLLLPVLRDPLNTGRFAESDVSLRMICGQPLDNGCFNSAVFDCAPSYETVI